MRPRWAPGVGPQVGPKHDHGLKLWIDGEGHAFGADAALDLIVADDAPFAVTA